MPALLDRQAQQSHWRDVIAQHATSGLTMIDFCRQHRLCSKTFYRWKARLNSVACANDSGERVPVQKKLEFLGLSAPSRARSVLLIRLASGVRISVFDAATIPAVLAGLRGC